MLPPTCRISLGVLISLVLLASHASQQVAANEHQENRQTQTNELTRRSIVFDLKTPKVFYCPQDKASDVDKMIVKAQPLDRLCEFEGEPRPKGALSDCYNDVDETEFACDEKRRFMIRLDLASEGLDSGIEDLDFILAKGAATSGSSSNSSKKKALPKEKKL